MTDLNNAAAVFGMAVNADADAELIALRAENARLIEAAVQKCHISSSFTSELGADGKGLMSLNLKTKTSDRSVTLTKVQWLTLLALVEDGTVAAELEMRKSTLKL